MHMRPTLLHVTILSFFIFVSQLEIFEGGIVNSCRYWRRRLPCSSVHFALCLALFFSYFGRLSLLAS